MPPAARYHRALAVAAALALLVLMVGLSGDYGATWDERFQQKYGEQVWDYLHGRLPRAAFDTDFGNQYLYGALVEVAAVAAQRASPRADVYVVRHRVTAVFGWVGILACGLIAARLFGAAPGWLAAALLALAPRYFGHAMNNPKDVPFAALSALAVLAVAGAGDRPPFLTWGRALALGFASALAINVRPLGVGLLVFATVFLSLRAALGFSRQPAGERSWRPVLGLASRLAVAAGVAVPLGTLFWPWAQAQPLTRPVEAFLFSSRAAWAEGFTVLHAGLTLTSDRLPWHYVPDWLAIGFPPVWLAGLALAPLAWKRAGPLGRRGLAALAVFAAAPILLAMTRGATLYDDIRHLYFVLPALAVLAAAGWAALASRARGWRRVLVLAALAAGLAEPLTFSIRNHPHQAVYFSPLAGGPSAAFGRYEMDYWGNSCLAGVRWAAEQAKAARMPLAVCGYPAEVVEADAGRFPSLTFSRRPGQPCHLYVNALRGRREEILKTVSLPAVVHRVTTADGAVLSVVVAGPDYRELRERLDRK